MMILFDCWATNWRIWITACCIRLTLPKAESTRSQYNCKIPYWIFGQRLWRPVLSDGKMNELSKETVFIDGTKLEASANKYTFVWKMGRKDVPKNIGSGRSAKPGVPTVFQCIERNQNTRYSEDMLFYRTSMRRTTYRFCTWKRKTQKPEPEVSGVIPPFSGTPDCLWLAYSQFSGKE